MNDVLRLQMTAAGWKPGTFRGFLMSRRAGIEFQVGPARASKTDAEGAAPRLELRYRYVTESTRAEAEEILPAGAGLREIEDAMTSIYLRVHERPDVTRVFGSRRRASTGAAGAAGSAAPRPVAPTADPDTEEESGQVSFDLF